MAPIGIDRIRCGFTAKKRGMAAAALLFSLAAVPVLADTAQEKVISRLASETSTETIQSETPVFLQMSQELEQGNSQEKVIRRLASETSSRARGIYSEIDQERQPGTATSLQVSQDLEHKQREIRNRLHGDRSTE